MAPSSNKFFHELRFYGGGGGIGLDIILIFTIIQWPCFTRISKLSNKSFEIWIQKESSIKFLYFDFCDSLPGSKNFKIKPFLFYFKTLVHVSCILYFKILDIVFRDLSSKGKFHEVHKRSLLQWFFICILF